MIHSRVRVALEGGTPVVALETAVLTHGLPHPEGLAAVRRMERAVGESGAISATVAVLDGRLRVGLTAEELERLAGLAGPLKVGMADLAATVASGASGGTTVAVTAFAAARAGIGVLATGGIGGVHRTADGHGLDVSGDLLALARYPVAVVCSGAKSVLDLPRTLELLETLGVPVVGYGTHELPGFYARETGLGLEHRVDTPAEAAELIRAQRSLGLSAAVIIAHPPPAEAAAGREEGEVWVERALVQADAEGVRGKAVTPFLLDRLDEAGGGRARRANVALLEANARVAGRVAAALEGAPPA